MVHDCITCYRNNPVTDNQIMGNLPPERKIPNFPFMHTGIDFSELLLKQENEIHLLFPNYFKKIIKF